MGTQFATAALSQPSGRVLEGELCNSLVLIVEDDAIGRAALVATFQRHGFRHIEEAVNGQLGLEKIISLKPSLVVMDVMMPVMDGIECCRRVRQHSDPTVASIPILVQTALEKPGDKARIFAAGATDYVTKPFDPREMMARAAVQLEREIMLRRLRDFNQRVAHELDTARTTQQVLMPSSAMLKDMSEHYGLDIYGHYQPCSELGGDFWGLSSLSADKLALYMIDFAGHGVGAALNVFRLHALMHSTMSAVPAPGPYLTQINSILAPLLPIGQFATMFYGVIDIKECSLAYASAGAPSPILCTHKAECHRLESDGMLLGIADDATFETREMPLSPGDTLLLFSDALFETEDRSDTRWPVENIAEFFGKALTAEECLDAAFFELLHHFNAHYLPQLKDDLTIACIRMGPLP